MKAVDFIIETPSRLIFLELKDPDSGPPERKSDWTQRLQSGTIDNDLKGKFRDTWLYLYGLNRIDKPIIFLVLIGLKGLSTEALYTRTENLKKQLPLEGPSGPWSNPLLLGCSVHNIDSWNRSFLEFQVTRM